MKKTFLLMGWFAGLLIGWSSWLVGSVKAQEFTPTSKLYQSQLDGAWQFPQVVRLEYVGEENSSFLFSLLDQEVSLNSSAEPKFLVANNFSRQFAIKEAHHLWLALTYQPWSQETQLGFDDPVLVVFFNDRVVLKKSMAEICCQRQTEKVYLGLSGGEQTLSIFAGEMGDLQEPSGIILQIVEIYGQPQASSSQSNLITTGPETVVSGNGNVSGLVGEAEAETLIIEPAIAGQVLGVGNEQVVPDSLKPWQRQIKKLVENPWFIWLAWLIVAGLIWLVIRDKKSRVTDNVRSGRNNGLSNKKERKK
ncbi:MAG TPA: hypothetical protein VGA89_03345 [Patescibacteria group bacterium]